MTIKYAAGAAALFSTAMLLCLCFTPSVRYGNCLAGEQAGGGRISTVEVAPELVLAKPLSGGGGFSWTLPSRLGDMIRKSEKKFGERDRKYTLLGVEFCGSGPQLWFPGDCGHVVIQLSETAMKDPARALYQLAHESIHLLSPSGGRNASVLEEGVATCFAIEYVRTAMGNDSYADACVEAMEENYKSAMELAGSALKKQPDFVLKLRKKYGSISSVTAGELRKVAPGISPETCEKLTAKFDSSK